MNFVLRHAYILIVAGVFVGAIYATTLPLDAQTYWLSEDGPVEMSSAIAYVICAAIMCIVGGKTFITRYYYLVGITLLFAMRELDFDKRFTTMGVLKSRFYLSDQVPLTEKLIGACVVGLLLFFVYKIVSNHAKPFIQGLLRLDKVQIGAALVVTFLVVSKSMDGIDRKLGDIGIQVSADFAEKAETFEETMELGIPLLMMATFAAYRQRKLTSNPS